MLELIPIMCGLRLGKNFLMFLQHWSGGSCVRQPFFCDAAHLRFFLLRPYAINKAEAIIDVARLADRFHSTSVSSRFHELLHTRGERPSGFHCAKCDKGFLPSQGTTFQREPGGDQQPQYQPEHRRGIISRSQIAPLHMSARSRGPLGWGS